ncbi:MAG: hypothetical protein J0I49_08710 [Pseudonocardia sp.]|uniref:hypothetical protein n=1 Tax=Pseudonocardia sp. TaxID=60912 RepID=UPI001AD0B7C6|nr:hypothetical protein [Pseudonocardia sp.]MBN9098176.1 hypothetical protein [Pseudonocardia sp.]
MLHLDQVLLTRQSKPVPDQGQDPHPGQRAQVQRVSGGDVGKSDTGQGHPGVLIAHQVPDVGVAVVFLLSSTR